MRVLFVVPPFAGHINPILGVAEELAARGNAVSWVGDREVLGSRLPPGAELYPYTPGPAPDRPADLRGFGALKFLWEQVLVPLTELMVPAVEEAVAREQPDVVVVDQQAFAGALVAERLGLPWVTSATTSSELTDPLAAFPKAGEWVAGQLQSMRTRYGDPGYDHDLRFSPYLILGYTTEKLLGDDVTAPGNLRLVGPVGRSEREQLPPEVFGDGKPLVYVSLGTVNSDAGGRFLRECVEALRLRPWLHAIVVDPGDLVTGAPANVVVRKRVPQLAVLARASAAVCHAGHNTVCESLAHGVPLVVAPIRDDQPVVAEQVVTAGAGKRVRFTLARAEHLGQALDDVLHDPGYAAAAREVQESFVAAGGAVAAADGIEALAVVGA